jgi:ectoine hydroxylase-related dioxygenase (phytanoyl-CoA dioxygenase family)
MAMIRRVVPSNTESDLCAFSSETIEEAMSYIRSDGALILEGIVDAALVREARQTFVQKYARYLTERQHEDALGVGDKRVMITVDVEPPFDRPELFANAWLLPLLGAIFIEKDFVLGGYGVVCSLPGAQTQHRHRDGGILFPQEGLDRLLPTAAVTVAIPLIEMNEIHGTTELWLGSHRDSDHVVTPTAAEKGDAPVVSEGSCVLWDYRLIHAGTPNQSAMPRPLVYMTYCRPWFFDYMNYMKQPLLRVSKRWLATLSEEHRRLLTRANAPWLPQVLP